MATKDRYVTLSYVHRSGRMVPSVGVVRSGERSDATAEWVVAAWEVERTTSDNEAVGLVVAHLVDKAPEFVRRIK